MRTSKYIKQKFVEFFQKKGHIQYKHSYLAPTTCDTTMFTIAGMKQFTDFFLGQQLAPYTRMITIQPCLRVNDLENVGKTARHHTFFEMLGNFSFGDYFKKEAIAFAYEFLTSELKLDPKYMFFTVFHEDYESYEFWKHIVGENKVIKIETEDNFWRAGAFGPCGPCTEIYFDTEKQIDIDKNLVKTFILSGQDRFIEIWNLVFMEFDQQKDGLYNLPKKCVDTGMGLERICSVYDNVFDNYQTDLFLPLIKEISKAEQNPVHYKIVADHLRAIVFLIGEGLRPSNEGQGYVLRNLIRRASLYSINLEKYATLALECLSDYAAEFLPFEEIIKILQHEKAAFQEALCKGKKMLESCDNCCEQTVFKLFDTYGLPTEISKNILCEKNIEINWDKVEALKKKHSEVSKKKLFINFDAPTNFIGYDNVSCVGKILFLAKFDTDPCLHEEQEKLDTGDTCIVVTDQTCFYPRGGGQEGDRGEIRGKNFSIEILNTCKQKITGASHIIFHVGKVVDGSVFLHSECELSVNFDIRKGRSRAHSGVHLFGEYLMKNFGFEQAGSFVDDDCGHLDLDVKDFEDFKKLFTEAEQFAQQAIRAKIDCKITNENFEEVQNVVFLNKCPYGSVVRVVEFPGFSKQLCGGTHVKNSGDIANLIIVKEHSIKRGVRRVEILTGPKVQQFLDKKAEEGALQKEQSQSTLEILFDEQLKNGCRLICTKGDNHRLFQKIYSHCQSSTFCVINESIGGVKLAIKGFNDTFIKKIQKDFELKGGGTTIIFLGTKKPIALELKNVFIGDCY